MISEEQKWIYEHFSDITLEPYIGTGIQQDFHFHIPSSICSDDLMAS